MAVKTRKSPKELENLLAVLKGANVAGFEESADGIKVSFFPPQHALPTITDLGFSDEDALGDLAERVKLTKKDPDADVLFDAVR